MGVISCDRSDCTEIMCHRMLFGRTLYICNDCFSELSEYKETWGTVAVFEVERLIRNFMETPVGTYNSQRLSVEPYDVEQEFKRLTEGTNED